ncbi:MAG: T9SS type A sorting domain-containing protein [Chitinophagaceae bacterium]|nr:T9SS type A sorting domain-containing protein [Chitinophagaceae bacterium]
MKRILGLSIGLLSSSLGFAQNFLNGSFELNTASDCLFNISNSSYNATLSHVKGIGTRETLDIFYDVKCPEFGLAQDGHYVSTLENPVDIYIPTAISLELSSALIAGRSYTFSYYDKSKTGGGPIELGVSADDASFGTVIYTSPGDATDDWTKRTVSFIAPVSGKYVTARYKENEDNYIMIDHFAFEGATSVEEPEHNTPISVFPNPASGELNIRLQPGMERPGVVRIFNQLGQLCSEAAFSDKINCAPLSKGVYILELKTGSQSYFTRFSKW